MGGNRPAARILKKGPLYRAAYYLLRATATANRLTTARERRLASRRADAATRPKDVGEIALLLTSSRGRGGGRGGYAESPPTPPPPGRDDRRPAAAATRAGRNKRCSAPRQSREEAG